MHRTIAAILLFASTLPAPAAQPAADPLGPARQGKAECFQPTNHHTCQSIAVFTFGPAGIVDTTTSILDGGAMTLMKLAAPATVHDGTVCTQLRKQDIVAAAVTVGGKPATAAQAQEAKGPFLASVAQGDSPPVCYTITQNGDHFTTHVTMNGKTLPGQDFIWVDSSYRVAP